MDQLWVNVLARCPAYTNVEESIKRELTVIMVPRFHSSKIKNKHLKDKTSWLSFEDMFQMFQYLYMHYLYWPSISLRWLETGQVLLFNLMDWYNVEVHNNTKEAHGQYLAILTEQVWSIKYLFLDKTKSLLLGQIRQIQLHKKAIAPGLNRVSNFINKGPLVPFF